ncbi:hypothetical protein FGG51_gp050 [Mycobacterium phage Astro]|uniref:Uncharacterized protein n=1 Tax=Mycobacterium phage Astro TaxID=2902840 RepID=I6S338_9CAUD|nr:hypothetical protein FGG51_gp050 [Mycobacterium phage Astro]AFM54947.1 hypothetical protein ASTRO_56 [Mycobacterium phage Astro]
MTVRVVNGNRDKRFDANWVDDDGSQLYVYDGDLKVAVFASGEWEYAELIRDNPDTGRIPQEWKFLVHIPHHIVLMDAEGLRWAYRAGAWHREDGKKSTDDWSGPFTEVFDD